MPDFINIAEDPTSLSPAEMQEMKNIIHQSFIETERQQIVKNQIESKALYVEGKLTFYDNPAGFINALNEE